MQNYFRIWITLLSALALCSSTLSRAQLHGADGLSTTPQPGRISHVTTFVEVYQEPIPVLPLESFIVYPEAAKSKRLEGIVVAECSIDRFGHALQAQVLSSSNHIFDSAAIHAVLAAPYMPGRTSGDTSVLYACKSTVHFRLMDTARTTAIRLTDTNGPVSISTNMLKALGAMSGMSRSTFLRTHSGTREEWHGDTVELIHSSPTHWGVGLPDSSILLLVDDRLQSYRLSFSMPNAFVYRTLREYLKDKTLSTPAGLRLENDDTQLSFTATYKAD